MPCALEKIVVTDLSEHMESRSSTTKNILYYHSAYGL